MIKKTKKLFIGSHELKKFSHINTSTTNTREKKKEEKSEEKQIKRTMTFGISKETQKVAAMENPLPSSQPQAAFIVIHIRSFGTDNINKNQIDCITIRGSTIMSSLFACPSDTGTSQ